jgi:hypothetical protein
LARCASSTVHFGREADPTTTEMVYAETPSEAMHFHQKAQQMSAFVTIIPCPNIFYTVKMRKHIQPSR